jgi:hypothetical protein
VETTLRVDRRPAAFWVSNGLKASLCGVVLLPAIHPEWQQYSGKGMWWRVVVFPLAGLVIPVAWSIAGSRPPYPHLADGLVVMIPLNDVIWNTVDAYDSIWWWDDVNHFVNSFVIAYVIALWLRRYPLGAVARVFLCLGVGMTLAVGWELAEYPTFLDSSDQLVVAYQDTLGDLGLSLIGSSLAALLGVLQPRSEESAAPGEAGTAVALAQR